MTALNLSIPDQPGLRFTAGNLKGSSISWAIYNAAKNAEKITLVITADVAVANQLQRELNFFKSEESFPILNFPDRETLPYDFFSPHPDIISERLSTLNQLLQLKKGIVLVSVSTLMQRLSPREYLDGTGFVLTVGQKLPINDFRERLTQAGYRHVSQVYEHGEYAVRGSIIDIFPMGSVSPYRIDLFEDEIDSLRRFDTETQRTTEVIKKIDLLPAHEFPLDQQAIAEFRQRWRERFPGNPLESPLYTAVSQGQSPAGIEFYLPLFFEKLGQLVDYLPQNSIMAFVEDVYSAANRYWQEVNERYEQLRYDVQKPLFSPAEIFIPVEDLFSVLKQFPQIRFQAESVIDQIHSHNFATETPPLLPVEHQAAQPLHHLAEWLQNFSGRVLFCAETAGRREVLEGLFADLQLRPKYFENWNTFVDSDIKYGITIAPIDRGLFLFEPLLALMTESQLFGEQVLQRRLRKRAVMEPDAIIRDLTELKIGSPVVHIEHGVGRYLGLQTIKTAEIDMEYLTLEYADSAKLYVPISALHLIGRYTGADGEHAPLHRLGSGQWDKIKRKAAEKLRDVAAELLNIYAQRAAKKGFSFKKPDQHYLAFASSFPFEETPDQLQAIQDVINDMTSERCMDRVVCGDVGFGKTEVAMRAAFMAVQSHKQVGVLVPTTLLAEQHLHSFQDRFAKWPVRVEAISRFRSKQEQTKIIEDLKNGKIDIVIGTHRLLQENIEFKSLGLLIVDEEHRFGVRQKERIKAMRAEVDLLTLTATPIPRTLNMAMSGIRDLSIIATPPAKRLSVKTFVREYAKSLIREAVMRETLRGGQVYFLHNEVQSIERMAGDLQQLVPDLRIGIAHGQMRESTLEHIMVDFYHQRFNILVCSTIIESGIDVPTANTIIINRADRFGLAQLHQLRGRVGRSHHQAYAYLLTPPDSALTPDAKKRLSAIESLEDLGSGFTLATHDLEIRGAGELLGEEQSGHILELGFTLYMEMLEDTVEALKQGKEPLLDKPMRTGTEVDLKIPALIPEDYLPDIQTRLMFYKRIANANNIDQLNDLQVEMIDRFGLLPKQAKNLFWISELKLKAAPMGVKKIDAGQSDGVIEFNANPVINLAALIQLVQKQSQHYKLIGNEKLRFNFKAETVEERFGVVEKLLDLLKI